MLRFISSLLTDSENLNIKNTFDFNGNEMETIVQQNRENLSLIPDWIDKEAFSNSCFNYGVPDFIQKEINKPLNKDYTYTDLMNFLARKHYQEINYLEIGVSVGKNFFQLVNGISRGKFTGFDIEEINPILEKEYTFSNADFWKTKNDSIKKSDSSYKTYQLNNKQIHYMCADVWDENSWKKLEGNKYNLIFSDALHTPEAILFEFEMLVKYHLLDKRFIIVWDDLVGKMQASFKKIIKKYNKKFHLEEIYLININGWVGQHETPHTIGIISNFVL